MGGAALLITAICWLPLMRNVTHSIAAMKKATARIAEGHFDVESRETRRDELGLLDRSINQMAERLQTFTEGRKRFWAMRRMSCARPLRVCNWPQKFWNGILPRVRRSTSSR